MPHAQLKLTPGIDQNDTPALNQAGISTCNLVRFTYSPVLGALVQKLGGWVRYFPSAMAAIVRALWAWEDTNAVQHLAVGTQNLPSTTSAQLSIITGGANAIITPTQEITSNIGPAASTTSGSATVIITDTANQNISSFDTVYIETHISIGGLILYGLYQCSAISATTYSITATNVLGQPNPATSTSTSAAVASFQTASGSAGVVVTLNNHGYVDGSTYPILVSTTVGGVTLYGNYLVESVGGANTFTIVATQQATSTAAASINHGHVYFVYSIGTGPPIAGAGYGGGGYGLGGYGTGTTYTPPVGTAISANDWVLDNWGEVLLACPINGSQFQPIYTYDPVQGGPQAAIIPQAPSVNDGFFVAMPQRQIIAWGSTQTGIQDPLLINWCDVNNYNSWVALVTNQAGSYRIPKGSRIVGGLQGPQQGLIWTDIDVWSMQYIGEPFVYSFNEIGTGCGLIARKACASLNGVVYWMGPSQFFSLSSSGVQPIACTVWDVVFQNLDQHNLTKIRVAVNALFGEVAWYFPTLTSGGEVAMYVKYNTYFEAWDYGVLGRSAWVDQSVLGPPIGADPASLYIYQHETSPDADGQPLLASFQSGYAAISDGDWKTFVDEVWPDMKFGYFGGEQNATVQLTFYVADFPGATPQMFGPYSITQATTYFNPRFRGRLVSIEISNTDTGSWWRIGGMRYRGMPDGRY